MKKSKICFLTLLLFFICSNVFAQIVNVEAGRIPNDTLTGWSGNTDVGFNFFKDVVSGITLGNDSRIQYETKKNVYILKGAVELTRFNFINYSNSGYIHFRHNYKFNSRWRLEEFVQSQYNQIMGIKIRNLVGIGPRVKVMKSEKLEVYAAALPMFEYQRNEYLIGVFTEEKNFRLSTYINFTLRLTPIMSLVHTTYFQPMMKDFMDYKSNTDSNLHIDLGERIAYNIGFHYTYNSRSIPFRPHNIYYVMNGLSMHL